MGKLYKAVVNVRSYMFSILYLKILKQFQRKLKPVTMQLVNRSYASPSLFI